MKRTYTEPPSGPVIPRWAVDDKLVVRFYGYFQETSPTAQDIPASVPEPVVLAAGRDDAANELKVSIRHACRHDGAAIVDPERTAPYYP